MIRFGASTLTLAGAARLSPVRFGPVNASEERLLVERARQDPEAFAELYRRYLPEVYAYAARRTGSREVAEDITSATFERVYAKLDRFRWQRGGFAPWVMRIAANETIAHYRREGRGQGERGQAAFARLHVPEHDEQDLVIDRIDQSEATDLRLALCRLNPRYQRAISLRYLAGLDQDEAATAMGLAKPAFAVVLSRALKALRREVPGASEKLTRHDQANSRKEVNG